MAAVRIKSIFQSLSPSLRHVRKEYSNFAASVDTWNRGNLSTVPPASSGESERAVTAQHLHVNGQMIHYEKAGMGKHVVLLLPGALGSSGTDFRPQLDNLNKDIFTIVAWDPLGYGKSRPPNRTWPQYFLKRDAEVAIDFMEVFFAENKSLGVEKYSLAGWSDGGITAMIMAGMRPERVRKLAVWGANAYVTPEEVKVYESLRDVSAWSDRMRKPFEELYGREYFQEQWGNWIDAFTSYLTLRGGDICKDCLGRITAPTLVLHGEKDPLVGLFHAEYLCKNINNSKLHVISEGKHNVHLRFYKEFNSVLEQFLI